MTAARGPAGRGWACVPRGAGRARPLLGRSGPLVLPGRSIAGAPSSPHRPPRFRGAPSGVPQGPRCLLGLPGSLRCPGSSALTGGLDTAAVPDVAAGGRRCTAPARAPGGAAHRAGAGGRPHPHVAATSRRRPAGGLKPGRVTPFMPCAVQRQSWVRSRGHTGGVGRATVAFPCPLQPGLGRAGAPGGHSLQPGAAQEAGPSSEAPLPPGLRSGLRPPGSPAGPSPAAGAGPVTVLDAKGCAWAGRAVSWVH